MSAADVDCGSTAIAFGRTVVCIEDPEPEAMPLAARKRCAWTTRGGSFSGSCARLAEGVPTLWAKAANPHVTTRNRQTGSMRRPGCGLASLEAYSAAPSTGAASLGIRAKSPRVTTISRPDPASPRHDSGGEHKTPWNCSAGGKLFPEMKILAHFRTRRGKRL